MIEFVLDVVMKLKALGKAIAVPLILGGIVAVPIGFWQLSFFQIETIGEGRAMMLISFLIGLVLVIMTLALLRRVKRFRLARRGRPNSESPWNQDH